VPFDDDATIDSEEKLLRRVHPKQVVPGKGGGFRPSSAAFNDRELSVDISSVLTALQRPHESCLIGYEGYGLVWFSAGRARANQQAVCRDPLPENPAHGIVFGDKPTRVKKQLVENSTWVVQNSPDEDGGASPQGF
jgi:hypothetical protein